MRVKKNKNASEKKKHYSYNLHHHHPPPPPPPPIEKHLYRKEKKRGGEVGNRAKEEKNQQYKKRKWQRQRGLYHMRLDTFFSVIFKNKRMGSTSIVFVGIGRGTSRRSACKEIKKSGKG